jgi:hypothetical protein
MTTKNLLGFHGLAFRSADPRGLAERWRSVSGLEPLRKTRDGYVVGGPELFVIVRKGRASFPDALEEVHLAVKDVAATRRKTGKDALGGDSWSRSLGSFDLFVRQFQRPPAPSWRRRRPPI